MCDEMLLRLGRWLRAAGYDTALIGKCHLQSISGARPTIGMPEADPETVQAPEHLREADKSWLSHGRLP